jgi:nitrogen-specific signal transduction histidine kinase
MNGPDKENNISEDALRNLKHDIKNQLSNIHLALEQLRYEVSDPTADALFYMDTIAMSSAKIDSLLK